MNLSPDIAHHHNQLTRIVATLFAMIGLAEGETIERLASPLYRAVLRVLRPAESALRRLIIVAAQGVTLKSPVARATPRKARNPARKTARRATFNLFDPRQRFGSAFGNERRPLRIRLASRPEPRLRVIDVRFDPRVPLFRQPPRAEQEQHPTPAPEGTTSARRLCRRLAAIQSALEDLPRQARRYLRWQSKPEDLRRPPLASALRRGHPPGHRNNPVHIVDEILAECDWLAREAARSNTS